MYALLAAVGLVVVIALVVVFTRGGPAEFAEDTPEGVVQRYSQAVVDGDTQKALGYLVPELADDCERIPLGSEDRRVTLLETDERPDGTRVHVMIATVYGSGPLGSSEYETEGVFDLVSADGGWLIETAPWELAVCAEGGVK